MEEPTQTPGLTTPNVDDKRPGLDKMLIGHREDLRMTATDLIDIPTAKEHSQSRYLLVLRVTAQSGFMESVSSAQTSCLDICNTCREHIPVQCLKIAYGAPPAILAMASPGIQEAATTGYRVLPLRKVLKVRWVFLDHTPCLDRFVLTEDRLIAHFVELAAAVYVDMRRIQWPEGVRQITLSSFNRRIDSTIWPPDLEILRFGEPAATAKFPVRFNDIFNMPLDAVVLPDGLRELFLGDGFNQPIEGVAWPGGLERLSLPGFNHRIRFVQWPPCLKALEFVSPSNIRLWKDGGTRRDFRRRYGRASSQGKGHFNQPLGTTLPASLESLWLSNAFRHSLDSVVWPDGLVTLGCTSDYPFAHGSHVTWPSNLLHLLSVNYPDIEIPHGIGVATLPGVPKVHDCNWIYDDHGI